VADFLQMSGAPLAHDALQAMGLLQRWKPGEEPTGCPSKDRLATGNLHSFPKQSGILWSNMVIIWNYIDFCFEPDVQRSPSSF
jgi:hypothetical protein